MIGMDQEFLLSINKNSDSEEVEEFKLPSTRNRRSKPKKGSYNAPSTKIATPATWSLFSWKCAVSFILLTALVSGGLIVAFFIMNIESEISTMKMELTKVKEKQSSQSVISTNDATTAKLVHDETLKIKQLEQKIRQLEMKLAILNNTSQKDTSNTPKQLSHRLSLVEKDVETMKTGLARMGGDIDKVNSQINSEGFEIGEVQTSVQKLTAKVKRLEEDEKKDKTKKNHEVAKPNEKNKRVVDEHFVNMAVSALEKKVDANTKYLKSFETLELTKLRSQIDSVNRSYLHDFTKLKKIVSVISNHTSTLNDSAIEEIRRDIYNIEHNEPNANILLQVITDVKYLQNISMMSQQHLQYFNDTLGSIERQNCTERIQQLEKLMNGSNGLVSEVKPPENGNGSLGIEETLKNVTNKLQLHDERIEKHHEVLKQMNASISKYAGEVIVMQSKIAGGASGELAKKSKHGKGKHRTKTIPTTTVAPDDLATSAAPTTPSKSEDSTTANVSVSSNVDSESTGLKAPIAPVEHGNPTPKPEEATIRNTVDLDAQTYPPNFTGKVFEQKARNESETDFPSFSTETDGNITTIETGTDNSTIETTDESMNNASKDSVATTEDRSGSGNGSVNEGKKKTTKNKGKVSHELDANDRPRPGNEFETPADEEGETLDEDDDDEDGLGA